MSKKSNLSTFRGRYDSFLSEASNEEIVSTSKELADELSSQLKHTSNSAMSILAISTVSVLLSIFMISSLDSSIAGTNKNIIFLLRMIAVAFMCISIFESYNVIQKSNSATSRSILMWRHVRETANEENTYEHMNAIRELDFAVSSTKSLVMTSVLALAISGVCLGFSYIFQMMILSGYI